jgi:toxin HigB-1
VAIQGFANETTRDVFHGRHPKGVPASILVVARRKLRQIHAAGALSDLKAPPGNRLHPLKQDREGQHAIRINDQFRICFRWTDTGPIDVEIVDYH